MYIYTNFQCCKAYHNNETFIHLFKIRDTSNLTNLQRTFAKRKSKKFYATRIITR